MIMANKNKLLKYNNEEEDEDEDEDEELNDTNSSSQKDALLFAIEVNQSMVKSQSKRSDSATIAAIKCALQVMQQQIISRPSDMIGVLLFGTEKSKSLEVEGENSDEFDFPHCYLLIDLDIPSPEYVKLLECITSGGQEADDILIPSKTTDAPVAHMLFFANQIFTTRAPNFGSRRLFIITDRDDPNSTDKLKRSQAAVKARDLYDLGVALYLFPISHEDYDFNHAKFYNDILYHDLTMEQRDDSGKLPLLSSKVKPYSDEDGISRLSRLISDINSRHVTKQSIFSGLPFEIGPDFQISVNGYRPFHRQKPNQSHWIYDSGEELKIATVESHLMTDNTATPVDPSEILYARKFGGSLIPFSSEEEKKLKFFESPIIRIIGFKSREKIPFWASIDKSTFIYPNEERCVGSTRVFSALWNKLLKDRKVAIAWYIPRSYSTPKIVAILPSIETPTSSHSNYNFPAGLWLYPLPFRDDFRSLPSLPPPLIAPDILIDEIRTVIQQLQLPGGIYDPFKYPNPALQWHYHVLQAMAVEDEISDCKIDDKTIPKFRQIDKRAGCYMSKWKVILEEQIRAWQKEKYGGIDGAEVKREYKKSKTPSFGFGPNKKKKYSGADGTEAKRDHEQSKILVCGSGPSQKKIKIESSKERRIF